MARCYQLTGVSAPPAAPPRFTLLGMAGDPLADPRRAAERWQGGFTYLPANCGQVRGHPPYGETDKTPSDPPDAVGFVPYWVEASSDCGTLLSGLYDEADGVADSRRMDERLQALYERRALDTLRACEAWQIENELWTGSIAQAHNTLDAEDVWPNRWLAGPNTTNLGAGDPVEALTCLEDSLAGCGCGQRGMIHATPGTVTWWARFGLLRVDGPRLLTFNDTLVVPGAGYPGTGPDGNPPETGAWAYATRLVDVRRDTPQVLPRRFAEAVDRRDNTAVVRVERLAAATWDGCCAAGVHVQFDSCAVVS